MAQQCSKCGSYSTRDCSECNGSGRWSHLGGGGTCKTCDGKGQVCAKCGSQVR
jgi:hypothetical protein